MVLYSRSSGINHRKELFLMRQSERVPPALNSRQPLIIYHLFPEASASFWPGSLLSSPSARPADPRTGLTQSLGFHDTSSCRKAELRMTNASAAGGVSAGAHTAAVRAVQVQQPLCFCFCVFYKSLDRTKLWRRRFICLLPSVKKSGCCYCLRLAARSRTGRIVRKDEFLAPEVEAGRRSTRRHFCV